VATGWYSKRLRACEPWSEGMTCNAAASKSVAGRDAACRRSRRGVSSMSIHGHSARALGASWEALIQFDGVLARNSSSHSRALPSDGARQSPRGDNDPPAVTFGPLGEAERLNWLTVKKR